MFQRFLPHIIAVIFFLALGGYWYHQLTAPQLPVIGPPQATNNDLPLPDFSVHIQVAEKKEAFFNFILPFVQQENERIARVRKSLLDLRSKVEAPKLSSRQLAWIKKLAERYRVDYDSLEEVKTLYAVIDRLLLKVDQVPPSLALAQAANESAWGTSRFAVKGNNLFGQWCFKNGCGLVPRGRADGASHEVARFLSPRKSVESYILNLNRNDAYRNLRQLRAKDRQQTGRVSGLTLAEGLQKYSTRREAYVEELKQMIKANKLDQLDSQESADEVSMVE